LTDSNSFTLGIDDMHYSESLPDVEPVTVKEQEVELRRLLHKHINKYCFENRYKQARINSEIKLRFRKKRDDMELTELTMLQKYIKKYYPVDGVETIRDIPGISLKRGQGKRVSTKVSSWTSRSEILKQSCYDPIRELLK